MIKYLNVDIKTTILFFLIISTCFAQTKEQLIDTIIKVNTVDSECVGYPCIKSEQYNNAQKLIKTLTKNELIDLCKHKNPTIRTYSLIELIKKNNKNIVDFFSSELTKNDSVITNDACSMDGIEQVSSVIYHEYWNKQKKTNDKTLKTLDSLIIFSEKPDWLLLHRAFNNRVYPKDYNSRILNLAQKGNIEAVYYLLNWYKADYKDEIYKACISYLKDTDFSNVGTSGYLKIISELLEFHYSDSLKKIIINKLKKDRHWEMDKAEFKYLLEKHYIYLSQLNK